MRGLRETQESKEMFYFFRLLEFEKETTKERRENIYGQVEFLRRCPNRKADNNFCAGNASA